MAVRKYLLVDMFAKACTGQMSPPEAVGWAEKEYEQIARKRRAWRGTPFMAITVLARPQSIPQELYDASAIDGAGKLQRFRYVTPPLGFALRFLVGPFYWMLVATLSTAVALLMGVPAGYALARLRFRHHRHP